MNEQSDLQSVKSEGNLAYLMENQAVIATMVYRLAGTASDDAKGNRVNDAYTDSLFIPNEQKAHFLSNQIHQWRIPILFLHWISPHPICQISRIGSGGFPRGIVKSNAQQDAPQDADKPRL